MKLFRTLATLALISTLGCDDDTTTDARYTARALEDGLLLAPSDADADHHALWLDVSGEDPKTTQLDLPGGAVTALPRPGLNLGHVVVLTSGLDAVRSGKDKRAAVPSSVLIFAKGGQLARKDLQGRYENLSLSPDGRYAIAFGSKAGLSVDNSAEVVDFQSDSTVFVDLSLDARAPTSFVFSPVGAFTHRVAVAPQPNALQIIDLDAPAKGPISVTLTAESALTPQQIVFSGDRMFVRSVSSNQIVILQAIEVPRGGHSWQPAPQVQVASSVVQDIAVIGAGASQRLLALTNALEVFDPAIGPTAKVDGLAGFTQILQFEGTSPLSSTRTARAMLYASSRSGASSNRVAFLDLGDETAWTTRNVEFVELGENVQSMLTLSSNRLAVAQHASQRASVIDLQARTVRRLVLNEYAGSLLVDEASAEPRLWALGVGGALGRVGLSSFTRIELPFSVGGSDTEQGLLLVPSARRRRIAVVQASETGRVTFVDADAADNDTAAASALEVLGIYLSDLLN